jgi:multisubunit Na+/H+ antiporter MnhE subunit
MIRTFAVGLFFWFTLLGFFSPSAFFCGLLISLLLWQSFPSQLSCVEECNFLLRLLATLPEAYRQGLLLLLGPRYTERTRLTHVPMCGRWGLFTETFLMTLTPENIVLRPGPKNALVVHDMEAEE